MKHYLMPLLFIYLNIQTHNFFTEQERHNFIPLVATSQFSKAVCATRQQYAIRLGYSITTHKTQGQY
jgi:hypothetical protein